MSRMWPSSWPSEPNRGAVDAIEYRVDRALGNLDARAMTIPLEHRPQIVPPDAQELGRGLWTWDLSSGARIMAVGVQADPLKDSMEWWDRQRETMPTQEFLRGVRHRLRRVRGKPVYPEYQDRLHAVASPALLRAQPAVHPGLGRPRSRRRGLAPARPTSAPPVPASRSQTASPAATSSRSS